MLRPGARYHGTNIAAAPACGRSTLESCLDITGRDHHARA
jgi:hypothetical protein